MFHQIGPGYDDDHKAATSLHGSAASLRAERVDVLCRPVLWSPQELC
jgi:hypothetical protein